MSRETAVTPRTTELAHRSLERLRRWVEANGWAGWDPFDVRAHPVYQRISARALSGRWVDRALLHVVYRAEQTFPLAMRRIARVRPAVNAMGMAYFARAYLLLAESGDTSAEAEADARISWLLANPSSSTRFLAWGYPFDWQSRVQIPAGTPSSVVTCAVADALRQRSHTRPREGDDARFHAIGRFLSEELRVLDGRSGTCCLSYTPLDSSRVHNANVMAGEYLVWAGSRLGESDWIDLGHRALRYTAADQEPSGAWDYWGPPDRGARHVDPYHTGFVIRMFLRAFETTGMTPLRDRALMGYEYLTNRLIRSGRPVATDARAYPVNVFSVAEGVLTLLAVRDYDSAAAPRLEELVAWATTEMQDAAGYFYYLWSPRRIHRLPMMRWSEATMCLALSAILACGSAGGSQLSHYV